MPITAFWSALYVQPIVGLYVDVSGAFVITFDKSIIIGLLNSIADILSSVSPSSNQTRTEQIQQEVKSVAQSYGASSSTKIDMGGKIVIDINFNGAQGLTQEQINQITKILSDKLSGTEFQNYIINVQSASKQSPTQRQGSNTYGGG